MEALTAAKLIRVVIVDDHPVFLAGLRTTLDLLPSVEVVGEARTGPTAVAVVRRLRPDLVLMDVDLPGLSGLDATRMIKNDSPETAVLMLTMLGDVDNVVAAMRSGATGYLLKGVSAEEVAHAVGAVSRGTAVFGSEVASAVFDYMSRPPTRELPFPSLTSRERAVLELVADGRGNSAIGNELGLSLKTVRNYLSRIFTKLQVSDRSAAAVIARRAGLGT